MTQVKREAAETRTGIMVSRVWTSDEVHPYDQVNWESRDIVLTDWRTGEVIFEQKGTKFPDFWSVNASQIVATKYFRGALGTSVREWSLQQLIDRVVSTYVGAGVEGGYFYSSADAEIFEDELTWMLLHQVFSFNSPVWFNVGTESKQQCSACFILSVEDTMEDILDWYKEEGLIFKGGSGSGINLSRIRGSMELLSSGGIASGPVSFMRGADASAGTIKSGGATRRSAKMVVLNVDHPDIEEFVNIKAHEEKKIRVLRDAGFDVEAGGKDTTSIQYQNANNSVRVSDKFMHAVEHNHPFDLVARTDGRTIKTVNAKELFRQIAQAAWECADPGLQYDDTINAWHTNPESGRIEASNPCSEYLSLSNSSCNLASLNLMKFRTASGGFDTQRFMESVELIITAMEISISFGEFPTEKITLGTKAFRQLGIGYANLGALLMANGLPYDSDAGRKLAADITSLMTAVAYHRSAELASVLGPYHGYERNRDAHLAVIQKHIDAQHYSSSRSPIAETAMNMWEDTMALGVKYGFRNAQASLLAPTGTIGFMMDVDTTGVEPDLGLVKVKKLVGGSSMEIINQTVPLALESLGYLDEQIEAITAYIKHNGHVVGAPGLRQEHYAVFDCAMGKRTIEPMGHVRMMEAVQPFLSGAISKTVNMPESATVEDIEHIYMEGWKRGLKALAVYRDNCKVGQVLSIKGSTPAEPAQSPGTGVVTRRRLPKRRSSQTLSFSVAGSDGYLTTSTYPGTGELGEVFLKMAKQGSTLAGVMDAFSIAVSVGLQHGVPLETYIRKFTNMRFEPAGVTDDPDIRIATSLMDYLFRRLALDHLPVEQSEELGIKAAGVPVSVPVSNPGTGITATGPLCSSCGNSTRQAGSCFVCESCGSTSGCS